jgi:uncharacterized protein YodC (DUF2158 family)
MLNRLEVGQVVRLKSGGPRMTITGIARYGNIPHDQAKCVWFEGSNKKEDVFELPALEGENERHGTTFAITE